MSRKGYYVLIKKKFPMDRILILADIKPMGYKLLCSDNLLFR